MPLYSYKSRNDLGELIVGVMNAADERSVALKLTEAGLCPIEIELYRGFEVREGLLGPRIRSEDIAIFSQQLATMCRAGITITQSLNILIGQTENKAFRSILYQVLADISAGTTLAQALAKHPKVFSELYVSTIRVGEESGQLDQVLDRLGIYLQRQNELIAKIKSQLAYPGIILCLTLLVIAFVIAFVLPKFERLFATVGLLKELPLPTQIMLTLSKFCLAFWPYFLVGIIVLVIVWRLLRRTPQGRVFLDRLKLNFPLLGPLYLKMAIIRFTRPLAIMVKSGVNLITAWEIVHKLVGNVILGEALKQVLEKIQQGKTMAESLRESNCFPPIVSQMVGIGEESGSLDIMLETLSETYERQIEYSARRLIVMIEPLMLFFIAGIVAFLAMAVYLPIFSLMKVVEKF